ncbi:MAG: PspA/IM30 family protein [Ruminococcus sp.]|nr:PspA/IM30 family protein [Ruminococcus sp.]
MDIFSRLSDLLQSNLNDLIDRAEDPEKMVRQIIADMQSELNKAVQNYSKVRSSQILTERKYKDALNVSQEWENKAKNALSQGDKELAKQSLFKKVKSDEEVALYKEMYESVSKQTEAVKAQVDTLRLKLDEAKNRQAILIARAKMADTQKRLSEISGNLENASAFDKFSRMEEAISLREAMTTAMNEISGSDKNKTTEQLEIDSKVNSELERLMSELNITDTTEENK